MGGGPKIVQPTPPPAPSVQDNLDAYVRTYPQLFALQQESAPKEIAQQLQLLQQYGGEYATAFKGIQSQLYPETTALQEDLAKQAQEGYTNGLTDQMKNMYRNEFKSLVGDQARAGIGADYVSQGLVNQDQSFRQYNQNLALSLAGRQPLTNPYTPQFTNQTGQMGLGDIMNYNGSNYGSQLSFINNGTYSKPSSFQTTMGNIGTGLQVAGGLGTLFCWVASEIFGGWNHPKTRSARFFIKNYCPKWFVDFYKKNGKQIAEFISDKPLFKMALRPLFEYFSWAGKRKIIQSGGSFCLKT